MTQIASTPPRTIRARIHDSAIRRVTRIYASTLSDVMTEALQNSRRADATQVRIAVGTLADRSSGEPRFSVTIADDGSGIADPAVLLSFGENGWSDDLVRREDAAGFGFASLSRRGCTVVSRPRSPDGQTQPGWRVDLAPEHFLGETPRPPKSIPMTERRFRTARRSRSRPRKPPPPSATPPRPRHATIRCRSSSRASRAPSPAARRTSSANDSNAAPSSTARSTPSHGAAWPSASSGTAIAATTTPTSISSA